MTPPAHRAKFGGPKRATADAAPGRQPRQRVTNAGPRAIARLRRGPATGEELTRLIYGDAPPRVIQALIGALRDQGGYIITHDWEGYHLVGEPETNAAGRATRSPAQAVYALLTTRGNSHRHCDCGANATHVALFYQLTADNRTRFINALPVCNSCAAVFTDAEQIISMEEAYAMANVPVPPAKEPGPPRGRPEADRRSTTPPTDCAPDGNGKPAADDGDAGTVGRLPWFAGRRHAPTG